MAIKRNKPNLKNALSKVDKSPKDMFGNVTVDISTLPCLNKVLKEKITGNFDSDVIEKLKEIAAKNDIPYTSLMNDILRKVIIDDMAS